MGRFDRLLYRLAQPVDKAALRTRPAMSLRLAVIARVAMRFFPIYLLLLGLGLLVTLGAGADIYHRTEMPQFCSGCHEMGANFDTWRQSRHGGIKCIDCHARPGLSGWVAAKTAGTAQLLAHFTAGSIEDIRLLGKHKDIVSENCQRCHAGAVRLNERGGLIISHEKHADLGLRCVACHAGNIAHPEPGAALDAPPRGLVDLDLCFKCHNGKQRIADSQAFAATDERNCGRCHPDARLALQHGGSHPSVKTRKPCLSCHALDPRKVHYTMDPNDEAKLCRKCHEAPKGLVSKHKPYAEGHCSQCHLVMSPSHLFRIGPRPTATFCLACHEELRRVLVAKEHFEPSAFYDDEEETDLHRSHAEEIGDNPLWCGACHAPHGSAAPRALVRLRELDADEEGDDGGDEDDGGGGGGTGFTGTATGGTCASACHADDAMSYTRKPKTRRGGRP